MLTPEETQVCVLIEQFAGPTDIAQRLGWRLERVKELRDWYFAERRLVWLRRLAQHSAAVRAAMVAVGVPLGYVATLETGEDLLGDRRRHLTDKDFREVQDLCR